MDYVYQQKTSLDHYTAEAFVLRCFDDRFWKVFKNFLRDKGLIHIDPESVAGGAKIFASPEKKSDRDFMLRELEKSILLHHTARVMLFTHYDCGAYGGLTRFEGDEEKQFAFHKKELSRALAIVKEKFPSVTVETYFIDKEGIMLVN